MPKKKKKKKEKSEAAAGTSGAPPEPAHNTLVLIADDDEATLLVGDARPFWTNPASGELNPQRAWRFPQLTVVVTGSGGPAITAVGARFLAQPNVGEPFAQVVNFGSCGRYAWSKTALTEAYLVRESRPWDLSFNFRGWGYFNGPMELETPPEVPAADACVCFSGGRYTTPGDRHWPMFLEADVEEYELYSLAWLCAELQLPLTGVKFVTDDVDGAAVADKAAHLDKARKNGTKLLLELLRGALGWPTIPPRHAGC